MELDKYVKKVDLSDEEMCLFNIVNKSIIKMDKKWIVDNQVDDSLDDQNKQILNDYGFIGDNNQIAMNRMIKEYNNDSKTFIISIELTRNCFLNCTYCYENGMRSRVVISKNVMDQIVTYVKNVFNKKEVTLFKMSFIGGEPLLAKKEFFYIYNQLVYLCHKYSIEHRAIINTNGILIENNFFNKVKNMDVCITLTNKEDHDKNRPYANSQGSYDAIVKKMLHCKQSFKRDDIRLFIRFNTNGENYTHFDEFLKELKNMNIDIFQVDPMYTDEYEQNSFRNTLSKKDFLTWKSTTSIDQLINNGFSIPYTTQNYLKPCKGYIRDNCKIFYDGTLGICDTYDFNKRKLSLKDVNDGKADVNNFFEAFKSWSPLTDLQCNQCPLILICGGKYFCRENCQFEGFDIDSFLGTFIKYYSQGKGSFFPNMV